MNTESTDVHANGGLPPVALRLLTRPVPGYAFAVIAVGLACLSRFGLRDIFGSGVPYLTFYPAVMLTAFLCGFGPGLLATALSALYVAIWILPPIGQLAISATADSIGLAVFGSMGIFMSMVAGLYHQASAKVVAYQREQVRLNIMEIAERKRAEEALRKSGQEFHSLAESMPQIVWATRPDGWNIYFNQQWVDYTGLTLEESYGHGWNTPFHPDDKQRAWDAWQRATQQNERYSLECRLRRADGTYRWWLVRGVPMLGSNGQILKWFGTCTDIEDLKHAESALQDSNALLEQRVAERTAAVRESEEKLKGIVGSAMDAIISADAGRRIVLFNAAAEKMFRCAASDAIGSSIDRFIPKRFHGAHAEHIRRFSEEGVTSRGMGNLGAVSGLRQDGEEFPIEASISQIEISGQNLFTVILRDVTELKRSEAAVRESEERFRTMVNAMPQLAWIAQPDGYIFWYNQRWYDYTGTTPEQMAGWGWQSIHDKVELPRVLDRWKASIATAEPFEMTFPLRGADGIFRPFLTRVIPLKDPAGRVVQWLGTNTDVHELKRAEDEIQKLNTELEERIRLRTLELQTSNHELEAFSYSVSHDLRAPLRGINGFSQALLDECADKLNPTGIDYLERILVGGQRMGQLIDDMLNLSRLSRVEMQRRQVSLGNLAREVANELRKTAPERTVEFKIADELTAVGDPGLLRVALTNLLENAWKFTAKGADAVIEFGVRHPESHPIYFVRDNGAGFDVAYADKLFQPFQRLHSMKDFPGTGIGLAIVARVIRRHGGRVWTEAAPGQGATFYFTLEPEAEPHG